jgi:hypothetical protein
LPASDHNTRLAAVDAQRVDGIGVEDRHAAGQAVVDRVDRRDHRAGRGQDAAGVGRLDRDQGLGGQRFGLGDRVILEGADRAGGQGVAEGGAGVGQGGAGGQLRRHRAIAGPLDALPGPDRDRAADREGRRQGGQGPAPGP